MTRVEFSDATGLSPRVLGDIETGRRSNFDDDTLAKVELALGWEPGSVEQVVQGGRARLITNNAALLRLRETWPHLAPDEQDLLATLAEMIAHRH